MSIFEEKMIAVDLILATSKIIWKIVHFDVLIVLK